MKCLSKLFKIYLFSCTLLLSQNYFLIFDGMDDYVNINTSISNDFSLMGWLNYETANDANCILASNSSDFLRLDQNKLVYKSLNNQGPQYIQKYLQPHSISGHQVHSSEQGLLKTPRTNFKTFGDRTFTCSGPLLWNKLLLEIKTVRV